jgi:hypothetical protein
MQRFKFSRRADYQPNNLKPVKRMRSDNYQFIPEQNITQNPTIQPTPADIYAEVQELKKEIEELKKILLSLMPNSPTNAPSYIG